MLPEFPYGQYITNFFPPGVAFAFAGAFGNNRALALISSILLIYKGLLAGET